MSTVNKLGKYKGIEVELHVEPVTEEEVQAQLKQLVLSRPNVSEKEGTIENGDLVTFDFAGYKDGVAFDGGTAEDYQLEIGSGQFIPGFEEAMEGMAVNEEKDIDLTFPENYHAADLAGQPVVFKVKVKKIETRSEAELNDEFVKGLGQPGMETVEELNRVIRSNLEQQKADTFYQQYENMILDKLVADSDVEVTEEEVTHALEIQLQMMGQQTAQMGMALEQYLEMMGATIETLKDQIRPNAQKQAVFEAIINEIIKVENIETTDDEANAEIEAIAKENNVEVEKVLEVYSVETIKDNFNKLKASRFIIDHAVNTAV